MAVKVTITIATKNVNAGVKPVPTEVASPKIKVTKIERVAIESES